MPHTATDLPRAIILHPNDGCLTVARALVRRGIEVHVVTSPSTTHVLASRGVTGRALPDPRTDAAAWLAELASLSATGGGVVICGSDAASEFVSAHRTELAENLRTFESTDGVHTAVMDKKRLYEMAAEIGVRAPWMHLVSTHAELAERAAAITYPCVLKATLAHVARAAVGHGTIRVESEADLLESAGRLLDHGIDVLVTEVVPGPETDLECAVTIRDRDGSYPLDYTRSKVRQWPPDYGVGSVMESRRLPGTAAINRQLLDHAGFVGISACETKRHSGNGELYLIEINVRVPNGFGLADAMGVDGSWRLYASAAGIPLGPQPEQVDGRKAIFPDLEFRAAAARVRAGDQTPLQVLRSYRGARDFGIVSLRDPGPAVAMFAPMVRRRLTRVLREAWQRVLRRGAPAPAPEVSAPVSEITPEPRRTA
ncbi:ATP-grasp domain-containing protein [Pseudonocardia broussonetiae]|uniref:ATP-grasp domain-containing protein n=1 Tax=Pseudonocardia broussonetiae TaxID=2736640 RepID=A0A6M6JGA9_9PSEU|nr:ATP-grasp domain-containing protein [Pseudonocardia broussonetiae]QJY47058.1 ATP-grasp domain-containing protein [Pseudonocardia broussonetiae]